MYQVPDTIPWYYTYWQIPVPGTTLDHGMIPAGGTNVPDTIPWYYTYWEIPMFTMPWYYS
jgi:hypothetical protein